MTRVLIVVLDALRPEFVTKDLMPSLSALATGGVRMARVRSTFPTETRVNQSAVTTGCYPRRHGVVANRFPLPGSDKIVNTGKDEVFEAALAGLTGPLLDVPSLGELLAATGRSLATLSAGTSGGGRLINIAAEQTGQVRIALRRPGATCPGGLFEQIAAEIGTPPPYTVPALDWIDYATSVWIDFVERRHRPDVGLLWLCEPDESFHRHGIGSPESLEAIRAADAALGRLLAALRPEVDAGNLQLIVMSDHGQVSLAGDRLQLAKLLAENGFSNAVDKIAVHNAGGIWLKDPAAAEPLVEWLRARDWCGPVFTRGCVAGTLPLGEIMVDHPRAADIVLACASNDGLNAWGVPGRTAHDAPYPGGCHGGLSRYELENVMVFSGSAFRQGVRPDGPAGNVDVLPTVLHLLGLPCPPVDGRVLTEALAGGAAPEPPVERLLVSHNYGPRTHLSVTEVGRTRYLNRAWVA